MGSHLFTFMGTGAGCGVPAFFCECPACQEARKDSSLARGDCGVMIQGIQDLGTTAEQARISGRSARRDSAADQGFVLRPHTTLLIDTPPDIRHYLNREDVRCFDELLYTHWHSDHVGGMLEMEYMMQLLTRQPIPIWASKRTIDQLLVEFHWMDYCMDLHLLEHHQTHEFDGVRYTALPVRHAPGTFGYLIETDKTRLFYASDTGPLPARTAEAIRGVDYVIMDATYWGDCPTDQHHSILQCIDAALELDAGTVFLTHLCMHYSEPITVSQLDAYLERYNGRVRQAMDGLKFEI